MERGVWEIWASEASRWQGARGNGSESASRRGCRGLGAYGERRAAPPVIGGERGGWAL